ncbi:uncharacterized protein LOC132562760 [Ylistrum balloti]|uniref:uncharacterized protein LOC132562760 n=1 Tax=Ylistrum balloti TaxID=509963 RepID=UPI00290583EF|nr:uncharacterized protein LOC132562760 [Ylistrum balloti]
MAGQTPVPGCTYHQRMGFIYICKTCDDELICTDCVLDRHNKHDLGKLTDYVSEQKLQIRRYQEKLSRNDVPKLENDIKENDENFKKSSRQFCKMIEEITRQGKEMKNEIDRLTEKLVLLCKNIEKINADITENNKTALTKHMGEEVRPQLDRCLQVLSYGVTDDVITVAKQVRDNSTSPPPVGTLKTGVFKPGTVQTGLLEWMLGTVLVDGENPEYHPTAKSSLVSSFVTSFPFTDIRVCSTGDEAWLSFCKGDKIHRVDQKGNIKERIECRVKVYSITVSPTTGRVWFFVMEGKSIRECTSDGNTLIRFMVKSVLWSLCITREDMVVVGTSGEIVMFTTDGRRVADGQDRVCRQEAVIPVRLSYCTQTGDVIVADVDGIGCDDYMAGKKPGKQPRVIVMNKHLKLKFKCQNIDAMESQTSESRQSKFYPTDVCFDGDGDILVAELVTKSVVLIDGNKGHSLRTIYIPDERIPWSISLHDARTL